MAYDLFSLRPHCFSQVSSARLIIVLVGLILPSSCNTLSLAWYNDAALHMAIQYRLWSSKHQQLMQVLSVKFACFAGSFKRAVSGCAIYKRVKGKSQSHSVEERIRTHS